MKKIITLSLLAFSFCWSLNIPKVSKFDSRIAYAVYNANDVFQINARNGYVSVLEFSIDERIINWCSKMGIVLENLTPLKNLS